jgi:SAM-dependent methyltransferase
MAPLRASDLAVRKHALRVASRRVPLEHVPPAGTNESAPSTLRDGWQEAEKARRYARERWSSERKRARDPRLVTALLCEHARLGQRAVLLDAPCGTGRLRTALERHGRYVGLDASPAMLAQAREPRGAELFLGDVERLPFRDDAFDVVVCCRLLHHLRDDALLRRALAELLRVSRDLVVASFWDSTSLPVWRRALLPSARPARRVSRSRAEIVQALADVGAELLGWKHSLRFVSRQAFFAARKTRGT